MRRDEIMQHYQKLVTPGVTPQNRKIPGREKDQHINDAGGAVFTIDKWDQFKRFLIIGAAEGTYYVSARDHAYNNIGIVKACINEDGTRAVDMIVDISDRGLAVKNDPALYALAEASAANSLGTRRYALSNLEKVARIPTHLFIFWTYVTGLRGKGRSLNGAVRKWYLSKSATQLAYFALKYKSREGISHADMLRLTRPKTDDEEKNLIFGFMTKKVKRDQGQFWRWEKDENVTQEKEYWKSLSWDRIWLKTGQPSIPKAARIIEGAEFLRDSKGLKTREVVDAISEYKLTHEMVPNEYKKSPEIWEALVPSMPPTALVRNLGRMSSIGLLKPMSTISTQVTEKLLNREALRRARLHPLSVLVALSRYKSGQGDKGSLRWNPDPQITAALNDMFYLTFETWEPSDLNTFIGTDVSGSMGFSKVAGINLKPVEVVACMAMVTLRTEPSAFVMGFAHTFKDLGITRTDSLEAAMRKAIMNNFGRTDCSLPMIYATKNKLEVDIFCVYTDNETYYGSIHPSEALQKYRDATGRNAKLVVCATVSSHGSIADPRDPGMLDIVGVSTDTPSLIANFAKG